MWVGRRGNLGAERSRWYWFKAADIFVWMEKRHSKQQFCDMTTERTFDSIAQKLVADENYCTETTIPVSFGLSWEGEHKPLILNFFCLAETHEKEPMESGSPTWASDLEQTTLVNNLCLKPWGSMVCNLSHKPGRSMLYSLSHKPGRSMVYSLPHKPGRSMTPT